MKDIKSDYPFGGMLFISVLGTTGLGLIIFPIIESIKSKNIMIFLNGLDLVLFGLVFLIFCSAAWISFIRNIVKKPREETVFLLEENCFLNHKGKKIKFSSNGLKPHKYYKAYKTSDFILEIREESQDHFELKLKDSFWLNWYSPYGDFTNILLLPIVYFFFSLFLFSSLLSPLPTNIIVGVIGIYPLYIIIYDLNKKIKKNKENQELIKKITESDK